MCLYGSQSQRIDSKTIFPFSWNGRFYCHGNATTAPEISLHVISPCQLKESHFSWYGGSSWKRRSWHRAVWSMLPFWRQQTSSSRITFVLRFWLIHHILPMRNEIPYITSEWQKTVKTPPTLINCSFNSPAGVTVLDELLIMWKRWCWLDETVNVFIHLDLLLRFHSSLPCHFNTHCYILLVRSCVEGSSTIRSSSSSNITFRSESVLAR